MTQFRLLGQTRQLTEYSCGASALQSVLSFWGRDIDEEALIGLIGTNAEVGTFVRGALSLGFTQRVKGHHEHLKTRKPNNRRPRDAAP